MTYFLQLGPNPVLCDLFLVDIGKCLVNQVRHWWQTKAMTPSKSRLVNPCAYLGYLQEHRWFRINDATVNPIPAWVTINKSCAPELPAQLEGNITKESPPSPFSLPLFPTPSSKGSLLITTWPCTFCELLDPLHSICFPSPMSLILPLGKEYFNLQKMVPQYLWQFLPLSLKAIR